MRQKDPAGVYLGGYGWVEDLQPGPPRTEVTASALRTGTDFRLSERSGFVHAPSLDHAATVAVLRRASHPFRPHPGSAGRPLAIDLSSGRARTAQYLLDGVRSGQPLSALLGYRFERALHERGLDVFIDAFRFIAPIKSAADDAGDRSRRCRRTLWWMGSSSCGKAECRRIAPRFSCSPATWRDVRCRRS